MFLLPEADHEGWEAEHRELIPQLRALGVEWFAITGQGETIDEARVFIERFGVEIIQKLQP
jgi:hypothetical protein